MKVPPKKIITWAEFRFSVIGKLLSCPPKRGELAGELKKLAGEHYQHPTENKNITFGVSTIERWFYKAKNAEDLIQALDRKVRSDLGTSKAISPSLLKELAKQYAAYSHWSYQLHSDNLCALLVEKPELQEEAPSYSSVLRTMKANGWYKKKSAKSRNPTKGQVKAQERLEQREVRSFESEYVHALWHLDFHESSRRVADENGQWHKVMALCIMDDFSRLCCHIQWFFSESAENLFHGLMQAFHKRGLPRALMTDNGSAMIAHETENGLPRLGICHDRTLPYSPYQNGKQESFWGQLEGRLLAMLSRVENLTLDFLNLSTLAWVEQEYNRSFHDEIKTSPITRVIEGTDVSRPSPDTQSLQLAFTVKEKRSQRRSDGTVSIKSVRFEIPSRFRHFERLWVRYQSWNLSRAFLVDQRTDHLLAIIYPQDKIKNFNGVRRTLAPLPQDPGNEVDADPIPPLLRKHLAEYAQTGLPPAYIPKNIEFSEEDNDE